MEELKYPDVVLVKSDDGVTVELTISVVVDETLEDLVGHG